MFKVIFLQPNVTCILQPLDQGLIKNVKRLHRMQRLYYLWKFLTDLKERIYLAADAWNAVRGSTIQIYWKKPLYRNNEKDSSRIDCQIPTDATARIIKCSPQFKNVYASDVSNWVDWEEDNPGFQIMSDYKIVIKV